MNIILTQKCLDQLLKIRFPAQKCVRITAGYEGGGCSCSLTTHLQVDQRTAQDEYIVSNGIPFIIDKTSQQLLDDAVYTLDFRHDLGYVLTTKNEMVAFGIRFDHPPNDKRP